MASMQMSAHSHLRYVHVLHIDFDLLSGLRRSSLTSYKRLQPGTLHLAMHRRYMCIHLFMYMYTHSLRMGISEIIYTASCMFYVIICVSPHDGMCSCMG